MNNDTFAVTSKKAGAGLAVALVRFVSRRVR